MKVHKYIIVLFIFKTAISQSLFNKIVEALFILNLSGTSDDGLFKPRDLDFHTDPNRDNELWVINENSAIFDPNFGGALSPITTQD